MSDQRAAPGESTLPIRTKHAIQQTEMESNQGKTPELTLNNPHSFPAEDAETEPETESAIEAGPLSGNGDEAEVPNEQEDADMALALHLQEQEAAAAVAGVTTEEPQQSTHASANQDAHDSWEAAVFPEHDQAPEAPGPEYICPLTNALGRAPWSNIPPGTAVSGPRPTKAGDFRIHKDLAGGRLNQLVSAKDKKKGTRKVKSAHWSCLKPEKKPTKEDIAQEGTSKEPAEKSSEKPAEKPSEKPSENPSKKSSQEPAEKPSGKASKKPSDKPPSSSSKKSTEKPPKAWSEPVLIIGGGRLRRNAHVNEAGQRIVDELSWVRDESLPQPRDDNGSDEGGSQVDDGDQTNAGGQADAGGGKWNDWDQVDKGGQADDDDGW